LLARMPHHWSLSQIRVISFSLLVSGEVLCGQTCLNAIGGQACPNDLPQDVRGAVGRARLNSTVGRACPDDTVGRAVPVFTSEMGTAPLRTLQNDADSMALSLLEIDIGKAEEKVTSTRFWRRLIPQVHLSASFGIRDLMFIDPASFVPYLIPHDSYRLTISLSLNELFFSSQHAQALFDLDKLRTEYALRKNQLALSRQALERQLSDITEELQFLAEELLLIQDLLRFNELRFSQGKIEFDTLTRTRLELLAVKEALQRLREKKTAIELKLTPVGEQ